MPDYDQIPNAQLYDYPYCVVTFEGAPDAKDFTPHLTLCDRTLALWEARGWSLLTLAPDVRGYGYRVVFTKSPARLTTTLGNAARADAWLPDFGQR